MTEPTDIDGVARDRLIDGADNVIRLVSTNQKGSLRVFVREANVRMDAQQRELEESEIANNLVRRIRDGDTAAETKLVERYGERLRFVLARQMAQFPHDVDDIVQESLATALLRLRDESIDDPARLGGFIYGIARNLRLAKIRDHARHDGTADPETLDEIPSDQVRPDEVVANDETTLIMRRVLAELGTVVGEERDREVLLRLFIHEQDKEEICRALKIDDPDHLRKVVYRAKARLKKLLLESETGLGPSSED